MAANGRTGGQPRVAHLEVVLELEGLLALGALELAQHGTLVVGDHVPLQPVHVGESLVAHLARLEHTQSRVMRLEPGLEAWDVRHMLAIRDRWTGEIRLRCPPRPGCRRLGLPWAVASAVAWDRGGGPSFQTGVLLLRGEPLEKKKGAYGAPP